MLTQMDIANMTNVRTYRRGQEINRREENFSNFTIAADDADGNVDHVHTQVAGSQGGYYTVDVFYDRAMEEIAEYSCTCPAFMSYDGPCKHCVAVMLRYLDDCRQRRKLGIDQRPGQQSRGLRAASGRGSGAGAGSAGVGGRTAAAVHPPHTERTSPAIKHLLEEQAYKQSLPKMSDARYGKIHLEPKLTLRSDGIEVEFSIGETRMYVLKDVFDFARNLQNRSHVIYGKSLEFTHTIESFDEASKPLARFLCQYTAERSQIGHYGSAFRFYNPAVSERRIELTGAEAERFLDCLGTEVYHSYSDGRETGQWAKVDEPPALHMEIRRVQGGIQMEADAPLIIWGAHRNYCFWQQKICAVDEESWAEARTYLTGLCKMAGASQFVAEDDVPAFCRTMLPHVRGIYQIHRENFDEEDYGLPKPTFSIYLDAPEEDLFTCSIQVDYDGRRYPLFSRENLTGRDLERENQVAAVAAAWFTLDESMDLLYMDYDEERLYGLLTEGLDAFRSEGEVYLSDAIRRINVKPAPKLTVGVSVAGDLLELTMTSGDMTREELVEILGRYKKKKKYYRLKSGDFISVEDDGIEVLAELKEGLQLTEKQLAEETIQLPKFRAIYLDDALREKDLLPAERSRDFRSLIRNMKTVEDNDFEVPQSLRGVLRPYQSKGFLWLKTLADNGFGGILADDMGLGKTLQVIAFLLSEQEEKGKENLHPTIIICPASLVYNWESEIKRFAPQLETRVIAGAAAERQEMIGQVEKGQILITSYDLLKRDRDWYDGMRFSTQVIDEAQYIKNPGTQTAKAVKSIRAGFRLALTGTPIENRLSELWSIFDYLMPGFLFSYKKFHQELEMPIVQTEDEQATKRLRRMIRPFVLRRLKGDVLRDLPDKIENNLMAEISGEQQKLYDAHVKALQLLLEGQSDEEFHQGKIQVLAQLTRLRQLCCDPALVYEDYNGGAQKLELCLELLEDAVDGGHKVLLFSQFTSMLQRIRQRLDAKGIPSHLLTGSTPKGARQDMVESFAVDAVQVFLISLKAGGTGLNLTAADMVIHYDPWWNLAAQNQATDRAHRIGQKKVVNVYKLITRGTVEEKILQLQEKKRALADQLLSGEDMGSGMLSREELLDILR